MSTIKNVLVVGMTGQIGPTILSALIANGTFNISVLTRLSNPNPSPPPSSLPANIPILKTDYTPTSLLTILKTHSIDAIVSTIGPAAKRLQIPLIDAAILAGVKRFIPSDYSYKTDEMSELEDKAPAIWERLVEIGNLEVLEYCAEMAGRYPGFTWTALGGGMMFDLMSKTSFLGTSLPTHKTTIIDSGNELSFSLTVPQLARAIISTLKNPLPTANRYLTIHSFVTTQNEVLAAAEKVTGCAFEVTRKDAETNRKEADELLKMGDVRGFGKAWASFFWEDGKGGAKDVGDGNVVLRLETEDLEDVIRGIVEEGA